MQNEPTLAPTPKEIVDLLGSLVSIDSVNPSLVPGAAGEDAIARFAAAWLREAGLDVEMQEVAPGRPNVVARLAGHGRGRSLLLNGHIDTVGVSEMPNPFTPRVEGDRLFGRGSYDMKGGVGAIMLAARLLAGTGHMEGDLIVTLVADEEYASMGTEHVCRTLQADAAIVTEPTGLRVCVAHKGFVWIGVETHGRAAHGSKPDQGVDAIVHMGRVLQDIEQLQQDLEARSSHPLLGSGSIHASLISGGQELSSYPERCRLQIERRTVPGETPEGVLMEISDILHQRTVQDSTFHATAELMFWREPFEVSMDEVVVQTLLQQTKRVRGVEPALYGDTPWMDAALLAGVGIPTTVFGPGGAGAHATTEYGLISEVGLCAEVLAQTALNFCR